MGTSTLTDKMRICVVTSSYPSGENEALSAAGLFVRDFSRILKKQGHEVYVFTHGNLKIKSKIDSDPEVVRYKNWGSLKPLSNLSVFNPFDLWTMFGHLFNGRRKLLELCHVQKIDVCVAMWTVPGGYWARYVFRRMGIPYVNWALGSDIWKYGRVPILKTWIAQIINDALVSYADGKDLCIEVERLTSRSCGFLPSSRQLPASDLKLSVDSAKKNFIYIGRYHYNKGPDVLLEAVRELPEKARDKMHFWIFGGGDLKDFLKEQVERYELSASVSLAGYIQEDQVSGYLGQMDAIVIPSRIESIPCVLSDAVQKGVPLIASDVGDMGTLVRETSAGLVFPSEDSKALSQAILKMYGEGKEKFQEGVHRLSQVFDIDKSAQALTSHVVKELD